MSKAGTWDRERRVIVKAEYLPASPNARFIVANLPGEPQEHYDQLFVIRGDMENRIKEQQLMLFADRTSCHDFQANRCFTSQAAFPSKKSSPPLPPIFCSPLQPATGEISGLAVNLAVLRDKPARAVVLKSRV